MLGRLRLPLAASALALIAPPALLHAQGQAGGRALVMIPYFEARNNADRGFGRDASEELRRLINSLPTYAPMQEREIRDQARTFDMRIEDLNCLYTVQLATQLNVPVAICANYTEDAQRNVTVNATIRNVTAGEEYPLEPFTVARNDRRGAAQQLFTQFDRFTTQIRAAGICSDYANSQQWENALRNCDESLAINPNAISVRFLRGRILYEMQRGQEALGEFDRVLQQDPFHEDALQLAGYISVTSGDEARGRDYYSRYLELNPGNVQIRMRIAYEMAEAGDPVGAMQFIQVGLDVDPTNVDLLDQYGGFAFRAALNAQEAYAASTPNAEGVAPRAAEYYREAIAAYMRVFEARGAETPADRLRNIIAAQVQLGDLPAAIALSERVLQTHPREAPIWTLYADALQRSGRLDDAVAALGRLLEIQPDHPTAGLRRGSILIQARRTEEALTVLTPVAQRDPQQADQAARLFFNEGYTNGQQRQDFAYSIRNMTAAKQLPNVPEAMRNQLNFWHGYSLFQSAMAEQQPQTLQTAQATLPKFREALQLFNQSGNYPASVNVNIAQLVDNANTYIEIQDAIIRRGR
jgi:tetratricopeptide (TPR) repeat protein